MGKREHFSCIEHKRYRNSSGEECSFADIYNGLTIPAELRKAYQQNDQAVIAAYGIKKDNPAYGSESACVVLLLKLYQELTAHQGQT